MSDRIWVECTVHKDDREKFLEIMGCEPETIEELPNAWEFLFTDMRGIDIDELGAAGIRFYGHHGPSYEYGCGVFVSNDERDPYSEDYALYLDASMGGGPLVPIQEDGTPALEDLEHTAKFCRQYHKLKALFGDDI